MKKFIVAISAIIAFAAVCAADSSNVVKVGGKYYVEDENGNLIKAPQSAIVEAPKRRPARAGKFGTPHPAAWHADSQKSAPLPSQSAAAPVAAVAAPAKQTKAGTSASQPASQSAPLPQQQAQKSPESAEFVCEIFLVSNSVKSPVGRITIKLPTGTAQHAPVKIGESGGSEVFAKLVRRTEKQNELTPFRASD